MAAQQQQQQQKISTATSGFIYSPYPASGMAQPHISNYVLMHPPYSPPNALLNDKCTILNDLVHGQQLVADNAMVKMEPLGAFGAGSHQQQQQNNHSGASSSADDDEEADVNDVLHQVSVKAGRTSADRPTVVSG